MFLMTKLTAFFWVPVILPKLLKLSNWLFKGFLFNIFDTIYLTGAHWHVFTSIICEKYADLFVFTGTCVIRFDPFKTRSDHFL